MQETIKKLERLESQWTAKKLASGIQVIHLPTTQDNLELHLSALFHVGSIHDPREHLGISHFLEHMLFRGSRNYPSFLKLANAFEWLGSEWNGGTSHEYTEYTFTGMSRHLAKALELFADFIQHPTLCDFEREQEIILREIDDDLNEYGFSMEMDQHCRGLFWPDSTIAQPILGTSQTVSRISRETIAKYREKNYQSNNLSLCIVGGHHTSEIFEQTESLFCALPSKSRPPLSEKLESTPYVGPRCQWIRNNDNQYHLCLSFQCEGEWSKQASIYAVICSILTDSYSARLPLRLRDELGLVYDVDMQCNLHSSQGTMSIIVSVRESKIETTLQQTAQILAEFAVGGPTQEELTKAKLRAEVDLSCNLQDYEALGFRVAWSMRHNRCPKLSTEYRRLLNYTADQVQETAQEIFRAKNCGIVLMGPTRRKYPESLTKTILQVLPS